VTCDLLIEVERGGDQRQVGECLGEVAEELAARADHWLAHRWAKGGRVGSQENGEGSRSTWPRHGWPYKAERRAGDECSLTPFFSLPLVHYLAAVGAPAIPCQNLTCLIRRNLALSIHCNQHSATLDSRAIELGLLPAVPRFA
jgi:hypothetical protein